MEIKWYTDIYISHNCSIRSFIFRTYYMHHSCRIVNWMRHEAKWTPNDDVFLALWLIFVWKWSGAVYVVHQKFTHLHKIRPDVAVTQQADTKIVLHDRKQNGEKCCCFSHLNYLVKANYNLHYVIDKSCWHLHYYCHRTHTHATTFLLTKSVTTVHFIFPTQNVANQGLWLFICTMCHVMTLWRFASENK